MVLTISGSLAQCPLSIFLDIQSIEKAKAAEEKAKIEEKEALKELKEAKRSAELAYQRHQAAVATKKAAFATRLAAEGKVTHLFYYGHFDIHIHLGPTKTTDLPIK